MLSLASLALLAVLGHPQPTPAICSLLTPAELSSVGVVLSRQGLMPDDGGTVTRKMVPALPADLRMEACTSEYDAAIGDIAVRFSVMTASISLGRAGWDAVDKALDDGESPPPSTVTRIGETICEQITQPSKEKGRTVSSLACHLARGARFYTIEFAQREASRLPAPARAAALLAVMQQRAP